jgi:hypothetical protein
MHRRPNATVFMKGSTKPVAHPLVHLIAVMVVRWRRRRLKPMPTQLRDSRSAGAPLGAGLMDYLKEAFLFRWNLLFLL